MVTFAKTNDIKQCKELWKISFGDDYNYIDFFFNNNFNENNLIVFKKGAKITSMMFVIDCSLGNYTGKYIYAACTHPDFRKQGRMNSLIDFAKVQYKNNTDFICLVPATNGLYKFYSQFGFVPYFKNNLSVLTFNSTQQLTDISFDEFAKLRQQFETNNCILSWCENSLKYAYNENVFVGGRVVKTKYGYAVLRDNNVVEWLSNDYKNDLININGEVTVKSLPQGKNDDFCGMIYTENQDILDIKNPYIGLVLD